MQVVSEGFSQMLDLGSTEKALLEIEDYLPIAELGNDADCAKCGDCGRCGDCGCR